ncbi:hypothetical protein QW060_26815 [Myroides ceti]|uniref:Uncharacterized protein n=1 Tax=Paenimyroides ceti TaxID=395087 RepID=A0ABT8D281_9FLAO|nr:hypothetical protein [Paenimyroides ceti]MDN3710431.1 hypothetical protein [Paenimyroides ceti]
MVSLMFRFPMQKLQRRMYLTVPYKFQYHTHRLDDSQMMMPD